MVPDPRASSPNVFVGYQLVALLCLSSFVFSGSGQAQIRGYNLFEFQVGNSPFTDPADQTTGFDQLNLSYTSGKISAHGRVEQFFSRNTDRDYQRLSQYRLSYREKSAEVVVGHFYDIIGRGLLLRAFEIPGVVFEGPASRVRQGFYRDIYGFKASYQTERFAIKAVRGKPLVNVLPATSPEDDRRTDLIEALEGQINFDGLSFGGAFMRSNNEGDFREYASASVAAELPLNVTAYFELAQEVGGGNDVLQLTGDSPFAVYSSLSYSQLAFGVSAEYKNYNNFFLGSGYNDPPSLVKEHPYPVLNRATHVLNVFDEHGFQIELFYRLAGGVVFTANVTKAVNRFASRFVFNEYFLEAVVPINERTKTKLFVDYGSDEFRFEDDRISVGGYVERLLSGRWSSSAEIEVQSLKQTLGESNIVQNYLVGLTISNSTKYSVGLVAERSTDPFLTDDPRTTGVIERDPRHWLGASFGYRPSRNHSISLFTGTRRGGPACTSGICYEVLDFEGMELRLTTRF